MQTSRILPGLLLIFLLDAPLLRAEQPQAKLPTVTLSLGDKTLQAEVADEDAERQAGMMFRTSMADGEAMLFVFERPQQVGFWMRNTRIPLSVAYLNAQGMILEMHDLTPGDETPVESRFATITYAIEVPRGWFAEHRILPGTVVRGLPSAPRGR